MDELNLDRTKLEEAKKAISDYKSGAAQTFEEIDGLMNTLFESYFKGNAANGLKQFYDKNIVPFGKKDDGVLASYLKSFDDILKIILESFLDEEGVDPTLGNNNSNIGTQAKATTTDTGIQAELTTN